MPEFIYVWNNGWCFSDNETHLIKSRHQRCIIELVLNVFATIRHSRGAKLLGVVHSWAGFDETQSLPEVVDAYTWCDSRHYDITIPAVHPSLVAELMEHWSKEKDHEPPTPGIWECPNHSYKSWYEEYKKRRGLSNA